MSPKTGRHTLDFGYFTINTPGSWEGVKEQGLDSYVGGIAADYGDTLYFDLGMYSNKLDNGYAKAESTIIDGRKAKLVFRDSTDRGISGIYFDSLWSGGPLRTRLNICGSNLKASTQKQFLDAVKTLRFYPKGHY
ncbi:hypothetical protein ACTHGU_11870 [Chitinophagaceae bacterium MMS25-I14]